MTMTITTAADTFPEDPSDAVVTVPMVTLDVPTADLAEDEEPTPFPELWRLYRQARFLAVRYDKAHPHNRESYRLFTAVWTLTGEESVLRLAEPHLRILVDYTTPKTAGAPAADQTEDALRAVTGLEMLNINRRMSRHMNRLSN